MTVERAGPITTVVLSRPEVRNAIDRKTAQALAAAFREFDADRDARVGVLFGEHGTFSAGADLKAIARGDFEGISATGEAPLGVSRLVLGKPVIAAIAGYAVGGGLELALWCDLRVAEADAKLGVYNRRWGVPLVDGGTVRLPRLIGLGRALDMILTGRTVTAEEAHRIGLVDRVVRPGKARAEAERLAAELASFPLLASQVDRRSVFETWHLPVPEALRRESEAASAAIGEAVFGARRFDSGRPPGPAIDEP